MHLRGLVGHYIGMQKATYKELSEALAAYIDEENGVGESSEYQAYATMTDEAAGEWRESIIDELGYYLAPSQLFENASPADYAGNARAIIASASGTWNESAFYDYEDWFLSTADLAS